ncbi:MAG: Alkylmercury lyase [Candidatus Heimdallarchaeota archaeon LC_3]|nr:MAG: Alkylmercury lyase [Candidatus Heimdallarchaeota archaeon LC_3]
MTKKILIDEIASKFRMIGMPPDLDERASKFLEVILKEVTKGSPVTQEKCYEIAAELNLSKEEIRSFIETSTERDKQGRILGLFGLTQNEYAHKFEIDGEKLYAFCGWDTLFLPQLLMKTAKVEVVDHQSKETIKIEISPEKVLSIFPPTAVLSIVIPEVEIENLAQVYGIFCSNVHFFASEKNLRDWFEHREYNPLVISIEEGFALGTSLFGNIIENIHAGR